MIDDNIFNIIGEGKVQIMINFLTEKAIWGTPLASNVIKRTNLPQQAYTRNTDDDDKK